MAVEATNNATSGDGSRDLDVLVSRQAVVDGEMRVTGYRVAYAALDSAGLVEPDDRAAIRLFGDFLSVVGLQELVGSSVAHLPVSREMLQTLGIPPIRPDRVMLRIPYETALDPELQPIIDGLAMRGYALSLYELPGPDFDPRLLERFGTVEADFSAWDADDAAIVAMQAHASRAMPLASGVVEHRDFELADRLGFRLFTGPFIATPRVTSVRQVPVDQLSALVALARLQRHSASVEELEQVINNDLGLSVKLLRYINSAYFGMRRNIGSIRQAVMMLGAHGVSRWALLVALTRGPNTPRELSVMALTRGRMCELIGSRDPNLDPDELFMVGMLSVADALLELPMDSIVAQLPVSDEVAEALLHHTGTVGSILDAAICYERGEFGADSLIRHRHDLAGAYRASLRWARRTLAEISA
jgi:EAL and modified HD-GYP domain-containing signal transduction protein